MAPANPVLVEVTRGEAVESRHRGAAVVVDSRGGRRAAWGDVDAIVFPRSSVKPLQALPLVESGASARFGVSARELALACASHSGEPDHVAAALGWLARLGRTEGDSDLRPAPADQSGGGRGAGSCRPRAVAAAQQLFRQAPRLSDARHAPGRAAERLRQSRTSRAAPGASRVVRDGRNGSSHRRPWPATAAARRSWPCRSSPSLARSRCWPPPMTCRARERGRLAGWCRR